MRKVNNILSIKRRVLKKFISLTPNFIKPGLRLMYSLYLSFRVHWRDLTTYRRSCEGLHRYWREPNGENKPETYFKNSERSQYLVRLMKKYASTDTRILEIGCNVGRNLNHLFCAGFRNLAGVEINKKALSLMKKHYSEMAETIIVYNAPIENAIKNFKDNAFDVVFTMAVLEHIHPQSKFIFPEIVRITRKYLITIEDEHDVSWRHFPRNYKRIFESFAMRQIYQFNGRIGNLPGSFWVRVFFKK